MTDFKTFISEAFQLTLKYHNKLNPKLWKNSQLDPNISAELCQLGWEFATFAQIPKSAVMDMVLTGGNANYNYTRFSDIDVHLICLPTGRDAEELYQSKVDWSAQHTDTRIAGAEVEFFAQPIEEGFKEGQGAWSLLQSKWIAVPKHLDDVAILRDNSVKAKVRHQIIVIRDLIKNGTASDIREYRDRMWRQRGAGLEKGGEFSIENIMYKDLRNRGQLQRLKSRLAELEQSES